MRALGIVGLVLVCVVGFVVVGSVAAHVMKQIDRAAACGQR